MGPLTLLFLAAAFVWLGTVAGVMRDAHARIGNPAAWKVAGAVAFFMPFAGAALWLCARPAETLDERRARRVLEAVLTAEAGPEPAGAEAGVEHAGAARLAAVPS